MKILSLFDGISCGMVALKRAGINVSLYDAYEIDGNAIEISRYNYSEINHKGDVFNAEYKKGEYDLLIGGSPCTYWSIARFGNDREVKSSGFGWELFMQYKRALDECSPKYFLYENNKSMSNEIREEITKTLGVRPIYINSNLLSAQNRPRLYWTNIPGVKVPEDKKIIMCDVLDFSENIFKPLGKWVYGKRGDTSRLERLSTIKQKKANCLTTSKTHNEQYYANEEKTLYTNLTVKQFEILQTLPVGYVDNVNVKQTSKYRAIGNGWTVDVISYILKHINGVKNEKTK